MTTIDIIILAVTGMGVIMGLMKGFVKQMASIVGLIAGLLVARALFGTVAERLAPALGTSTTIAQVLAFILIWVAVPLGFAFVASLLTKALDAGASGVAESLAGQRTWGIEVYDTDRVSYSCDRIYRPER